MSITVGRTFLSCFLSITFLVQNVERKKRKDEAGWYKHLFIRICLPLLKFYVLCIILYHCRKCIVYTILFVGILLPEAVWLSIHSCMYSLECIYYIHCFFLLCSRQGPHVCAALFSAYNLLTFGFYQLFYSLLFTTFKHIAQRIVSYYYSF